MNSWLWKVLPKALSTSHLSREMWLQFTCGSVGRAEGCMCGWSEASAEMHRDNRGKTRYQWCRRPNETGSLVKEENDLFNFPRSRIKKLLTSDSLHKCVRSLTWSTLSAAGRPGSKAPVVALSGASVRDIKLILHSLVWLLADQLRGEKKIKLHFQRLWSLAQIVASLSRFLEGFFFFLSSHQKFSLTTTTVCSKLFKDQWSIFPHMCC